MNALWENLSVLGGILCGAGVDVYAKGELVRNMWSQG